MPQAGFDPPAQSEVFYQTTALPPSHHGWICLQIEWANFNETILVSTEPTNLHIKSESTLISLLFNFSESEQIEGSNTGRILFGVV